MAHFLPASFPGGGSLICGASLHQQRQKPGCSPGRPLGTSLSRSLGLCCPLSPPQRLLVRWHCRPGISGERKLQRAPAGLFAGFFSPQLFIFPLNCQETSTRRERSGLMLPHAAAPASPAPPAAMPNGAGACPGVPPPPKCPELAQGREGASALPQPSEPPSSSPCFPWQDLG